MANIGKKVLKGLIAESSQFVRQEKVVSLPGAKSLLEKINTVRFGMVEEEGERIAKRKEKITGLEHQNREEYKALAQELGINS